MIIFAKRILRKQAAPQQKQAFCIRFALFLASDLKKSLV
jgi:hypothetical protein